MKENRVFVLSVQFFSLATVLAATALFWLCHRLDFLFVKILTAAMHLTRAKLSFQCFCKSDKTVVAICLFST